METITVKDNQGNFQAEATRSSKREPWTIHFETGEERWHGSLQGVRKRIDERLKELAKEQAPTSCGRCGHAAHGANPCTDSIPYEPTTICLCMGS